MNDEVLLANGREAIPGMIANALGVARIVGHEFEVRPVETHQLGELVERQHAIDQENLVVGARERLLHEPAQLHRHGRLELEPDHRSAPSALEDRLELAHQIFRFFLDLDLRIADDAEGALSLHCVAGEQPGDEQPDHLLERDHPGVDAPSALGRRMKRSILFGMRMSAFIALPSLARAR